MMLYGPTRGASDTDGRPHLHRECAVCCYVLCDSVLALCDAVPVLCPAILLLCERVSRLCNAVSVQCNAVPMLCDYDGGKDVLRLDCCVAVAPPAYTVQESPIGGSE
jgi:hypothetical protein